MSVKRIALWSGPRNVSTALMYSFAQRTDTTVIDEPLFGYFLEHTGAVRPSRKEVLAIMKTNACEVINEQLCGKCNTAIQFQKHIACHLIDLDWSFINQFENVILTRDPKDVLLSYTTHVSEPTILDLGYKVQVELLHYLMEIGRKPIVLDSRYVLENPEGVLRKLCELVDIEFDKTMLSWKAGARPEDGLWAKYWYHSLHKSTGFGRYKEKTQELPKELKQHYQECLKYYEQLIKYSIR